MPPVKLTRRAFLRLTALVGIGAGLSALQRLTEPVGPLTYFRWMARGKWQQTQPAARVALAKCPDYEADILSCLRGLWAQGQMPDLRGKRLLVKPNLVDYIENHPATTDARVVAAVVDYLAEAGAAEIVVGDGPAFRRDALPVAEGCGLLAELRSRGISFVDLNYDDPQPVPARDGWLRRSPTLWLPRHVREADYIVSVPKLKTHHWALVSLSMKNLLGVVPGCRYGWPKNMLHINGFLPSILGVYASLPPVLAVIDGIVGMQGDGPLFGTPVPHGFLAVGSDPVAVDTICAGLMGFPLEDVTYLATAGWAGLGQTGRIELRGDTSDLQRHYKLVE